MSIEDFPENEVDSENLPQIELHTKVTSKPPGNRWIAEIDGENIIKERWTFEAPSVAGKRQGYDINEKDWSQQKPWGWSNVANARRPKPHRIQAFATYSATGSAE